MYLRIYELRLIWLSCLVAGCILKALFAYSGKLLLLLRGS